MAARSGTLIRTLPPPLTDGARATAEAAEGADHLRVGHGRVGAEAHGLHGEARHLGARVALQVGSLTNLN